MHLKNPPVLPVPPGLQVRGLFESREVWERVYDPSGGTDVLVGVLVEVEQRLSI